MKIYSKKINHIVYNLIGLGVFITPYLIRRKYLPSELEYINFFVLIGVFIYSYFSLMKNSLKIKNTTSTIIINMVFFIVIVLYLISVSLSNSLTHPLHYFVVVVLPITFSLLVRMPYDEIVEFFRIWIRYLNVCIFLILICTVIDLFLGLKASQFFASFYNLQNLKLLVSYGRIITYMGHPLLTAELVLQFFIMNFLYNRFISKNTKNEKFIILISLFLMASTVSKSGSILLVILFILLYFNKSNFKWLVLTFIIGVVMYNAGLFDSVRERLLISVLMGDITTGRNSSLIYLINAKQLSFNFFSGRYLNSLDETMIAALEYPILRWAYQIGILFSFFMSTLFFIIPLLKLTRKWNFQLIISTLAIIVMYNLSNGLASINDDALIYSICIFIIINLRQLDLRNPLGNINPVKKLA